jgi:hypothetical protein
MATILEYGLTYHATAKYNQITGPLGAVSLWNLPYGRSIGGKHKPSALQAALDVTIALIGGGVPSSWNELRVNLWLVVRHA